MPDPDRCPGHRHAHTLTRTHTPHAHMQTRTHAHTRQLVLVLIGHLSLCLTQKGVPATHMHTCAHRHTHAHTRTHTHARGMSERLRRSWGGPLVCSRVCAGALVRTHGANLRVHAPALPVYQPCRRVGVHGALAGAGACGCDLRCVQRQRAMAAPASRCLRRRTSVCRAWRRRPASVVSASMHLSD